MNWLRNLLFGWLNKRITIPKNTTPAMSDIPKQQEQAKPDILTDDPDCEIVIKCGGREIRNVGQVTYIKRSLTCAPFDGHNCVGVQYDITGLADGERTVFVDKSRKGTWQGVLPDDIPIGKMVCWYE